MKVNEGTADRVIRIVAGALLLYIGFFVLGGAWGIVLDVLGVIALVTGATGFCLLYRLFGDFSTAHKR
jgi:hypothetical protein